MKFKIGDIVELDPSYDSSKGWREYNNIEYGKEYKVVDVEIESDLDEYGGGLLSVINDNGKETKCFCDRFKHIGEDLEPDDVAFY